MPKSFQIKLSFPSCVLSMPPIPSFSISSTLISGNSSLCNFQILFDPNLPFTGLYFIFSSIYRNPKENACKNRTQQLCMYSTHFQPGNAKTSNLYNHEARYKLSLTQSWEVGKPCCAPASSSRKQLYNIHEDVQHLEVTIWTHRSQRQAPLST